jgi:ribosome-binding factor A
MEQTKRQAQVCSLLKQNISIVLQNQGNYIYGTKPLVTVTDVKISPDLMNAKIYLSIFNTEEKQQVILLLEQELVPIRQALAGRVRNHLRRCPEIAFYEDETLDEMYRIKDMFQQMHNDNQMGDGRTDEDYKLDGYEEEV